MEIAFRRSVVGVAAAAVAMLSTGSVAQAATLTLDISQTVVSQYTPSYQVMAQTFTADTSATLARVSLPVASGLAKGTVGIEGVASTGTPNGTYLATPTSFSSGFTCCWNDFNLNPVAMTKGTKYAIVMRVSFGPLYWGHTPVAPPSFPTADGQLWVSCLSGCLWYGGGTFPADFGFETWISGGAAANQAPTVAANSAAVTVAEGTPPADTGTYGDPDGDTVKLTATSGTLATNATAGTWSWTGAAADEGGPQTVTVTADDGHGLTSTASFAYTVTAVAPATQIVTDPVSAPEGTAVNLTGSATSPYSADNASFSLAWNVTKDNNPFAQGSGASFSFTPDDEGTYLVTFQATDDGGMTGTSSLTIAGTNVAPAAAIGGVTASAPLVIVPFESLTFSGSFSDPGVLDTHTVTWDFGDGTTSTTNYGPGGSATFSASHAYAAAGTYAVNLTVTDDDTGVGQAGTTINVQTPQAALASIASSIKNWGGLTSGERQSLIAKLDAASAAIARGDDTAANNELNAFLAEVSADLKTGKLTLAQATELRGAVHAVQGALGTYIRFLDWGPFAA